MDGHFQKNKLTADQKDKELTALHLFDYNGDGYLDLYLGFGHNGEIHPHKRQDAIALNNGSGVFNLLENALPVIDTPTSKVLSADLDQDGDMDLIVAARVKIEGYPESPKTTVLIRETSGFMDQTEKWLPNDGHLGMLTDMTLIDVDKDGAKDLIYAGEWMPFSVLKRDGNKFVRMRSPFPKFNHGWWNVMFPIDIDSDGDVDIIAGNHGLNFPYQLPLRMDFGDFNGIGQLQSIISQRFDDQWHPIHLRDNLLNQIQILKKRYPDYQSYAQATTTEILSFIDSKESQSLELHELQSVVFINQGKSFQTQPLEVAVQIAPIFGIQAWDINNDGRKELFFVGNDPAWEVFTGPKNASMGVVLNHNQPISATQSGFVVPGPAKHLENIRVGESTLLLVAQNGGRLLAFRKND